MMMNTARPVHRELIPLPQELRNVPSSVLEDYVLARLRQFSKAFGPQLHPGASEAATEGAYQRALTSLGSDENRDVEGYRVRFRHRCRFLGCQKKDCLLCKNNPNKRCLEEDNFDECYADNQILKSKCEADIFVELYNHVTGVTEAVPSLEIQISVIDGESYASDTAQGGSHIKELLKSDEGQTLLGSYIGASKVDGDGRLCLKPQDGQVRLPDVFITDKNDTFHLDSETYGTFRMLGRAVKRDLYGNPVPVDNIPPAVSAKFIVKTQRALNDYRKSEYPHYKDELTKLKFIGSITAQRLREVQQHLGFDLPFTCIETVQQLRDLMLHADQNRQVETKLLDLLNMKGKHKHKWDFLRDILSERIVYDDMQPRAWYADAAMTQGLLFACKQAQVNIEKPMGIVQRVVQAGQARLQVVSSLDAQQIETVKYWRHHAEQSWATAGHKGWTVVQEPLEIVNGGASVVIPGHVPTMVSLAGLPSSMSGATGMDEDTTTSNTPHVHTARRSSTSSPHASARGNNKDGDSPLSHVRGRRRSSANVPAHIMQAVMAGAPVSPPVHSLASDSSLPLDYQFGHGGGSGGPLLQHLGAESFDAAVAAAAAQAGGGFLFGQQPPRYPNSPINSPVNSPMHSHYGGNGSGGGNGAFGPDSTVFTRTSSAPAPGGHGFFNQSLTAHMAAQQMDGGMGAAASLLAGVGPAPVGSHRLRRMSADAGIVSSCVSPVLEGGTLHYNLGGGGGYDPTMDQGLLNKRSRDGMSDQHDPTSLSMPFGPTDFSRVALYHQESRGRHTPRGRILDEVGLSSGGGSPMGGGGGGPNIFQSQQYGNASSQQQQYASNTPPHQLQQYANPDLGAHLFGALHSANNSAGGGGGAGSPGGVGGDGAAQRMSYSLQQATQRLQLRDDSSMMQQQQQQQQQQQGPGSGDDGMGGPRMLRHSDSDSFKRLIEPMMFPGYTSLDEAAMFDSFMDQMKTEGR